MPRRGWRARADVHRPCLLAHFRLCERATGPHVRPGAHFAHEITLHRA
ncbi:hypothetical protein [Streptomyces adustus]|nr:hypothetical protein [Streptomyces adustus]